MKENNKIAGSSFDNFCKALRNLERSLSTPITEPRDLSGIIKDFEMVYELSWKVLKKVLRNSGHETLGAKDVYSKAFQLGYLEKEQPWLVMIEDRNKTSHVYDEKDAKKIIEHIRSLYIKAFQNLETKLKQIE